MTTGEEESRDGRSSQSRDGSKSPVRFSLTVLGVEDGDSLLAKVDLLVPLSPNLGRSEHATRSAHVTESGLSSTVGSSSRDTGNTGNSTTYVCVVSHCSASPCSPQIRCFHLHRLPTPSDKRLEINVCTNQYPRTQQKFGDRPSRSQHMVDACSSQRRCERSVQYQVEWAK